MNTASELVTRYSEQLEPCHPPYDESTRRLEATFKSFRDAVVELPDPTSEIGVALLSLQNLQDSHHLLLWITAAIARPDNSYVLSLIHISEPRDLSTSRMPSSA